MIYSNKRKLGLSGWLKQNSEREYDTPLKLQKFLLFYESFSKVAGETVDFSQLRGYKRGTVFSDVWGDYTKEWSLFDEAALKQYQSGENEIDEKRARKSAFIVETLTEAELSGLTHRMNLWKAKEERIQSGEYQVDLDEEDFNQEDVQLITLLDQMYPEDVVKNSVVIPLDNHYFVFQKDVATRLTEQHFDVLSTLSEKETLYNPVYVGMDEEGRLIID